MFQVFLLFIAGFVFVVENVRGLPKPEFYWVVRAEIETYTLSLIFCLLILSWASDGNLAGIGLSRKTAIAGTTWGTCAAALVLTGTWALKAGLANVPSLPEHWQSVLMPQFLSWEVTVWYARSPLQVIGFLWREALWVFSEELFSCFVISRAVKVFRRPYLALACSVLYLGVLHTFYGWEQLNFAATCYFTLSIAGRGWLFLKTRSLLAAMIPHYFGNLIFQATYGGF